MEIEGIFIAFKLLDFLEPAKNVPAPKLLLNDLIQRVSIKNQPVLLIRNIRLN